MWLFKTAEEKEIDILERILKIESKLRVQRDPNAAHDLNLEEGVLFDSMCSGIEKELLSVQVALTTHKELFSIKEASIRRAQFITLKSFIKKTVNMCTKIADGLKNSPQYKVFVDILVRLAKKLDEYYVWIEQGYVPRAVNILDYGTANSIFIGSVYKPFKDELDAIKDKVKAAIATRISAGSLAIR